MNKLLLLLCLLLFGLSTRAQKSINIAFLADEHKESFHFENLKSEIKAVLGSDFDVIFNKPMVNGFDLNKTKHQYAELNKAKTDLIIGFGTTNALFFYKESEVKIPTIILGGVNKDLIKLPVSQTTSEKNNVNYIILPNSYTGDLDDLFSIFKFNKIGIIIRENKIVNLPISKTFDDYFANKPASYMIIPIVNNSIDTALLNGVDAVYFTDGYMFSNKEIENIVEVVNSKKLPSFSANGIQDVEMGFLASNKPQGVFKQIFAKTALHTEAILNGTNPSSLPMFVDYNNQLTINYSTQKKIGLKLRYSVLGSANFIGGLKHEKTQNSISLITLMENVVDRNLGLKSERKNIELANQEVKSSKSSYLPDLSANVQGIYIDPEVSQYSTGQNPEFETKADLTLKQLLYSPGASTGIKIKEKLSEAQSANYSADKLDALLNTASAYFNALILKTNASIQNQNLQLTKQNIEIAKQNFEAGASGKSDILRFRSELAQNTQRVIDASNDLDKMYLVINQLLNNSLFDEVEIEDADISKGIFKDYNYKSLMELMDSPELLPKLVDFFIKKSLENAPELKSLDLNKDAIDLSYNLNKYGRYIPTVALQGQYNIGITKNGKGSETPTGYPELPNNTYNGALNISLPIFGQNLNNIKQQTALIQKEQLDFQKQSLVQNLEKNVQEVVLDLISSIANIELSKLSEETAKESLDLTQTAYQTGSITIIQLIDAQNNFLQSKMGSATAKYNFLLTSIQLERMMGYFFLTHTQQENDLFFKEANQFIIDKN